jgi:hypothetical protein
MSDSAMDVQSRPAAAAAEPTGRHRLHRIVILSPGARFLTLAAAVFLAACGGDSAEPEWGGSVRDSAGVRIVENPDAGVWTAGEAWTLEEELKIGVTDGDPELQFGIITGIDATPGGEIYILDAQAHRIRVFDAEGTLVRAFGQAGQGPGELSQALAQAPPGLFLSGEGTLLVPDMFNQRITRFTREGEPSGSVPMDLTAGIPMVFAAGPDGTVYQQVRRMTLPGMAEVEGGAVDLLYVLGDDGSVADTLARMTAGETFSFGGGAPSIRIFAPENLWTVLGDGSVVSGKNTTYSLDIRNPQGQLSTILRRASTRRPVTESETSGFRRAMRSAWEDSGMPPAMAAQMEEAVQFEDSWPALAALLAGPEGTLWVQRVDPDNALDPAAFEDIQNLQFGSPAWDVFDAEGRYLGIVEMPERFTPRRVVGDLIYGVQTDAMGVARVARLRVVRGGEG